MALKARDKDLPPLPLATRAVLRDVIAGSRDLCCYKNCKAPHKEIMWSARRRVMGVVANVYEDGKWNRVEHFHQECYAKARKPHGKILEG